MRSGRERQLRVVVFNDVVGSSEQIFADELIAVHHIKNDLALIKDTLQRHGGYLVKSLGDGLLSTFDAPTQALEFVQDAITQLQGRGARSLKHRFGLHVGEIYADGDDIIGQGVHLASRLQTIAPPNGVAFVQSTYDMVDPDFRRRARPMGPVTLAGLPNEVVCWSIEEGELVATSTAPSSSGREVDEVLADTPYRIERGLGRFGAGHTFLVRDSSRDRLAVLKLFHGERADLEKLEVEAATLDRLRHPRIPRVVDVFLREGHYCLLQEWIPGASLAGSFDFLRKKQRLSELLRRVLEVLDATHRSGILHGDLRPANLIPAADTGQLFVVDFSLIKSRSQSSSPGMAWHEGPPGEHADRGPETGENARTYYNPPELARFGRLWPGVDLYALGVTALVLHTGKPPGQLYDQAQGGWHLEDLDPEVLAWLSPLLEESPGRRLQSAADALQLLDRPALVAGGTTGSSRSEAVIDKSQLVATLSRIYGPVVQLLLESWPNAIPPDQIPALRARLEQAGLGGADLARAIEGALQRPAAPRGEPIAPSPAADDARGASPEDASREAALGSLQRVLRQAIGPVADLLLGAELVEELLRDEEAARRAVEGRLLTPEAIAALLEEARRLRESPPEVPTQPAGVGEAPPASSCVPAPAPIEETPSDRLRQALLRTLGPIGAQILEDVEALPPERRLEACLGSLRQYAVAPELIAEVERSCRPGAGTDGR